MLTYFACLSKCASLGEKTPEKRRSGKRKDENKQDEAAAMCIWERVCVSVYVHLYMNMHMYVYDCVYGFITKQAFRCNYKQDPFLG